MVRGYFSSCDTGEVEVIEEKINGLQISGDNKLTSAGSLRLKIDFPFQQDNNPTHTVKATQKWFAVVISLCYPLVCSGPSEINKNSE